MDNNQNPLVSIIMPMKNTEDYVSDAVTSILNQTYTCFELIIVDDGSSDSSRKIVTSFQDNRIKVIAGQETGAADAFNLALQISRGKYICNCDSDDKYPEDRLDWQVKYLDKHPDIDAVCATYSTMSAKGKVLSQFHAGSTEKAISGELLSGKIRTAFCTYLTRRNTLVSLGGYRTFFTSAHDLDIQLRMAEKHHIYYLPHNAYFYRLHDSSITHTQPSNQRIFFEDKAKSFLQQRRETGSDDLQRGNPPQIPSLKSRPTTSNPQISGILTGESWRLHQEGKKFMAVKKGIALCLYNPVSLGSWRNLLALIVKPSP